mgnify:CR=1 FL=1
MCNDKDAQIAAVLAEGETLSKRQAEQEQTIRKLRANIRDVQTAADKQADVEKALRAELAETKTKLEHAQAEIAEARRVRAVCGPSSAGLGSADRGGGDGSVHSTPAEHALALQQALRRAETAEAKESSLSASIAELHLENARLAQAARWRDEGLTVRLGELETRSGNAEAHASELAAAVARETQPLLKQVASLQSQLSKVHAAWKASDADLKRRLAQAEASAATSGDEAARHLSALAAGEAELARVREHAAAERKSLMEARDAADARALGEGKRASLAEAEVARVRHSLERAEAALAQSDHALAETRGRATDLAAELRHEREVSNEERRARAQEMHDSRAQQVQARVQAGRLNGAIDIADWRSSSLLKPTRVAGVQSWHADGSGGNTSNEGDSVGLRALIAAMEAKEQVCDPFIVNIITHHPPRLRVSEPCVPCQACMHRQLRKTIRD